MELLVSSSSKNQNPGSSTSHLANLNNGVRIVRHPNGSIGYQKQAPHDHEELPTMAKQYMDSSKGKSESIIANKMKNLTMESKSSLKHPIDDTVSQSESSFCQSPSNIMSNGKPSFTNTEVSESGSCSGDVSRKTSIYRESTGSDFSDESSSSCLSSAIYKPHKANDVSWEAIQAVRCRKGDLDFKHFRVLKRLGCGDIGSVYLSELTGTNTYFAMKVMDKALLASRKKLLRAQTEREILQSLDHPFLPTLYTHFETEKLSCLVMEFCPGGDLHALRQRQPGKYFSEQAARFYVAEVLLAMEYLHMLGIIYRDLKPENVLVRADGHIMLSDFDLSLRCAVSPTLVKSSNLTLESKNSAYCAQPACIQPTCIMQPDCIQPACFGPRFFSSKSKKDKKSKVKNETNHQVNPLPELMAEPTNARSMSFVGTHEYLAPEIIKGEGHGSAVDWWTFGIFLYELLFGKTPFKGAGNRATLFNVVGQPLKFPDYPNVSFAARDLIRGLLVKEPQHRLAYRRGATEVKQHPFFQSVNWALIRCANPPDVPKQSMMDFSATRTDIAKVPTNGKGPGLDVKPSGTKKDGSSIHFFHRTINAYATGQRKGRKIQNQDNTNKDHIRWHKTGKTKPVIENGVHKGWKKIMVLYKSSKKGCKAEKLNWVMHQYHLGDEEDEHDGEYVVSKIAYQHQKQTEKNNGSPVTEEPDNLIIRTGPRTPITITPNPPRPWKSMTDDDIDENMHQEEKNDVEGSHLPTNAFQCEGTSDYPAWFVGESQAAEYPGLDLQCNELLDPSSVITTSVKKRVSSADGVIETKGNNDASCGISELENLDFDTPPDLTLADIQFGSQESILSWLDRL